jgi:hypothetical protein
VRTGAGGILVVHAGAGGRDGIGCSRAGAPATPVHAAAAPRSGRRGKKAGRRAPGGDRSGGAWALREKDAMVLHRR